MDEHPTAYGWAAARAAGLGRRRIAADGVRVGRGAYLSRAVDPTLEERCHAWTAVLPAGAAFGLGTAAFLHGAPVAEPIRPHVVVPTEVVPPRHPGLVAVTRGLTRTDVAHLRGLPVTSGAQTWLDLAAAVPDDELVAVGDALLRGGAMDEARLAERLARADGLRGVVRARRRAGQLTGDAASRPESLVRVWLLDSALPDPEVQVPVFDRWGREVAHGDLGWRRWRVLIEYEGAQHADPGRFGEDIERYTHMAADGWLVLRFGRAHLHRRWAVLDRCERALRSRGWTP
ncbi:hypothetical protein [Modestobacter sp. NPDC049651]|uniref:hypothetical protein n=1 Tax=unclassified Modestobacter TaxID=2643866 RepID=UPI0033FB63C6